MLSIHDETTFCEIKSLANQLATFLSTFSWLCDAYILEFFTEDHWSKLPPSWQKTLSRMELDEFSEWMMTDEDAPLTYKTVWPLSLQSFRATCRALSLPRKLDVFDPKLLLRQFQINRKCVGNGSTSKLVTDEARVTTEQHFGLSHMFRRCVKPKKQHEILRLAQVVNLIANSSGCHNVIDIGSGQGHLSRLLSVGYGLNVTSLEAEGSHIAGAQILDTKATNDLIKKGDSDSVALPNYVIHKISTKTTGEDFIRILDDHIPNFCSKFVMVGLHTCGNLAPSMIKVFSECKNAVALVSVACCYMKVDTELENDLFIGYPLSESVSSIQSHRLTYEAREVACHAIELYKQRLKEKAQKLKIHCYRAVLEVLITKFHPDKRRIGLRGVKRAEEMLFSQYAKTALGKLKLDIPKSEFFSEVVEQLMSQWTKVVLFYSLRLLIAPVIETLLLIDRALYIYEKGFQSLLFPGFDPNLSPRNHILIAMKP